MFSIRSILSKLVLTCLFIALLPKQAFIDLNSLVWQKTFGRSKWDWAYSIQQTRDGGYIIAGEVGSFGKEDSDLYILKIDRSGNLSWEKTFGGNKWDTARSIHQTTDGGYIIAGITESFGSGFGDIYISKLDANGDLVWERTFGGSEWDTARSIQQTKDGGYIVAGLTKSFGVGNSDIYILKLDADGNLLWEKTFGGEEDDEANAICQTRDGGYAVAGFTRSYGSEGSDVYVLKLDADGNLLWEKTFGRKEDDEANAICQTRDGGYAVAGWTESFGARFKDVYILRLDSSGNLIWEKPYGGSNDEEARDIKQTIDGGYIIAGWTESFGPGDRDVYVLKIRDKGDLEWQKTYGGKSDDEAYSVCQTMDGGYIIAGQTESFGAGFGDIYIIKTDSKGNTRISPF